MINTIKEGRQGTAELRERLKGTLSQISYGKGFYKSCAKHLMQHTKTCTGRLEIKTS